MAATDKRTRNRDDLLNRLQSLLYEYETLGRFAQARPHILWLMEIALARQASVEAD